MFELSLSFFLLAFSPPESVTVSDGPVAPTAPAAEPAPAPEAAPAPAPDPVAGAESVSTPDPEPDVEAAPVAPAPAIVVTPTPRPEERKGEYILESRNRHFGSFGGPKLKLSSVASNFVVLMGGGGGIVLGKRFSFGGAGYGLVHHAGEINDGAGNAYRIDIGYGGLQMGAILWRPKYVDLAFDLFVGGGGACLERVDAKNANCVDHTGFFVTEPELVLHIRVARFFRIAMSGGYRFAAADRWRVDPASMSLWGPTGSLALEFGWF